MINGGHLKDTWTLYNALRFLCIKEIDFKEIRIRKEGPPLIIFPSSPLEQLALGHDLEVIASGAYLYTDFLGVRFTWLKH